jgi:hypothetical protein
VLGIGRGFEFLFGSRPNAGFPHYPGHTVFPAPNAVIDKVPMDFGSTVYTVAGRMQHSDLCFQSTVLLAATAFGPFNPAMVS